MLVFLGAVLFTGLFGMLGWCVWDMHYGLPARLEAEERQARQRIEDMRAYDDRSVAPENPQPDVKRA